MKEIDLKNKHRKYNSPEKGIKIVRRFYRRKNGDVVMRIYTYKNKELIKIEEEVNGN